MIYDLSNKTEQTIAYNQFNHLLQNERLIELKEIRKSRTTLQNSALHQFYVLISNELNNLGMEFQTIKISKWGFKLFAEDDILCTRYTPEIVKDYMWRPIQKTLFDIKSTKDLNTIQINEIADVLIKFFGEKGVYLAFPSIQSLLDKSDNE